MALVEFGGGKSVLVQTRYQANQGIQRIYHVASNNMFMP